MKDNKVLSTHQPDLFPYEQYWRKMAKADLFVLLPVYQTVGGTRSENFQSYQKILAWEGPQYIKIPCTTGEANFNHTCIKEDVLQDGLSWREYHLMQLRLAYGFCSEYDCDTGSQAQVRAFKRERILRSNVSKAARPLRSSAPHFETYYPRVAEIYRSGQETLGRFNTDMILFLKEAFGIATPVRICTYDEPASPLEIRVDHNMVLADQVQMDILQTSPRSCSYGITQLVNWLRESPDSDGHFSMPVAEAVNNIIEELEAMQDGSARTEAGQPKKFKLPATAKLIRLLQHTGHDIMLSGAGSEVYAVNSLFSAVDLSNTFHHGVMTPYTQISSPLDFQPYLCALDILFNKGELP